MLLVRDVLDKPLLDGDGHRRGTVDGIVLLVDDDGAFEGPAGIVGPMAPKVLAIEHGTVALARRFGRVIGACIAFVTRWFAPDAGVPTRIAFDRVRGTGRRVVVDVDWERERLLSLASQGGGEDA